jgi:hypothetical protein
MERPGLVFSWRLSYNQNGTLGGMTRGPQNTSSVNSVIVVNDFEFHFVRLRVYASSECTECKLVAIRTTDPTFIFTANLKAKSVTLYGLRLQLAAQNINCRLLCKSRF